MKNNQFTDNFAIELTSVISDNIHKQPPIVDMKNLLVKGKREVLADIPISADFNGKIISRFGDETWLLWPYYVNRGNEHKSTLNFSFLEGSPQLLLEIKVVLYIWLRIRGQKNPKKRIKVETLVSRYEFMTQPLKFLQVNNNSSLCELCEADIWEKLGLFLEQRKLSYGRLTHIYSAIMAISWVRQFLPFSFEPPVFEHEKLSKKLAAEGREETIQTFAIPQRLADLIYGDALALVEYAWPNRERIAELIQERDELYQEVKENVDKIIESDGPAKNKHTQKLFKLDRNICNRSYRDAINTRLRRLRKENSNLLLTLTGHHLLKTNKKWVEICLNRLLTASYICTHAFTGMRKSEVYQLQPGCYASRIVNGHTFHILLGATHKLSGGIKREEWLCSPGAGKSVELAESLTRNIRKQLQNVAEEYNQAGDKVTATKYSRASNCLWLQHFTFGKLPRYHSNKMMTYVKKFVVKIGANVTEDDLKEFHLINRNVPESFVPEIGKVWSFYPLQMRRTFAVFGGRNNLSGIAATKQQFKHLKIRMPEYYCRGSSEGKAVDARLDTDLMEMIFESRLNDEATELHQLYNNDSALAGGRGKVIMSERRNAPLKYSSWDTVKQLVKQGKLTYHSTGVAGCSNGYNCEMDTVVNPAFCVECDGAIITIKHAQIWQQKHAAMTKHIEQNQTISSNEISHFITQIRAAEIVMADHNISYKPFEYGLEFSGQ